MRIILASSSPRRRELLAAAGIPFEVAVSDVPEVRGAEAPEAYVRRLAREKASAVAAKAPDAWVIAADTIVVLEGDVLEKPVDRVDAARMLGRISGRTHTVYTGVTLLRIDPQWEETTVTTTDVTMLSIPPEDVAWYVETGEPLDKAGAYAVQGVGGWFIERIEGNYTNVVGLPLSTLFTMMRNAGIDPLRITNQFESE